MWPSRARVAVPSWWQKLQSDLMRLIQWFCSLDRGPMPLPLAPVPGNSLFAGGSSSDSQ